MLKRLLLCCILTAPIQAFANGYQLQDQSVRAMGMADAVTAIADDASAIWYNPAGLAFQKSPQISLGVIDIYIPSVDFTSNTSNPFLPLSTQASSKRKNAVAPHVYMSYAHPILKLAFGLGINTPFGLETDWTGTALANATTFSRIQMVNVNPVLAYRITNHLAIAIGLDYAYVKNIDLNNSILTQNGHGDGWGGNIGILYRQESFSLAATYRTQIAVRINGTASSKLGGAASATTSFKLPDMVNIGIAFHPTASLTISMDADWTNWGKYDQIVLNYSSPITIPTGLPVPPVIGVRSIVLQKQWHATISPKIGLSWRMNKAIAFRLGYSFDPSPVNDTYASPDLPINDQHNFTVGFSMQLTPQFAYDLAYLYAMQTTLHQTAPTGADALGNGTYKGRAHLFGISGTYTF